MLSGRALGGAGSNAVLCKICNVLLCVLEQPRVDNSNTGTLMRGVQLGAFGLISVTPVQYAIVRLLLKNHYSMCNLYARESGTYQILMFESSTFFFVFQNDDRVCFVY